MSKWHTDYSRDGDSWLVTCPYCQGSTRTNLLSDAVKAGLKHAETCKDRAHLEGA